MTINLPALSSVATDMSGVVTIAAEDTEQILVAPNGSDNITIQGTTDNDSIENTGAAGEYVMLAPAGTALGWLVIGGYNLSNFAHTGP